MNLKNVIDKLNAAFDNNEKFSVDYLLAKAENHSKNYPEDKTAGAMVVVLQKVANKTPTISKSDFKDLYNRLYSSNTLVANAFKDELGEQNNLKPSVKIKTEAKYLKAQEDDSLLGTALKNMFDNKETYFSAAAEKSAKNETLNILSLYGVTPKSLNVTAGNENIIILQASYETPKGLTSLLIPVATYKDVASAPTDFVGDSVHAINKDNVTSYLKTNAGIAPAYKPEWLVDTLSKKASADVSDIDLAVIRIENDKKQKIVFASNQILGQEVFKPAKAIAVSVTSGKYGSLEDQFTTPQGQAKFLFGEKQTKIAADVLYKELISHGYEPQLKIAKAENNTIDFVAMLDGKVSFTVPMKIGNVINSPDFLISNGSILPLTKDTIDQLFISNENDYKAAASISPQFELTPDDLINNIKLSVAEGNLAKAEDALNILSNKDKKAYMIGFEIYKSSLVKSASKNNEPEHKCSLPIKTAHSKYVICGHTNLPIHKTYIDKYGKCTPNYRKGFSEEVGTTVLTTNQKIFG